MFVGVSQPKTRFELIVPNSVIEVEQNPSRGGLTEVKQEVVQANGTTKGCGEG